MESAETSVVPSDAKPRPKARIVKTKYGIRVPVSPRRQAIFFNKSDSVEKIKQVCDSLKVGSTNRVAALSAGMLPEDLTYMIELGKQGHPLYGRLIEAVLKARGRKAREMQERIVEHAMTDEGVVDGTLEKAIIAEERDSWLNDRGPVSVATGMGVTVNFNTNFGDEKPVDHSVVDAEDVEFEELSDE